MQDADIPAAEQMIAVLAPITSVAIAYSLIALSRRVSTAEAGAPPLGASVDFS